MIKSATPQSIHIFKRSETEDRCYIQRKSFIYFEKGPSYIFSIQNKVESYFSMKDIMSFSDD